MYSIVVCAHGDLAESLKRSVEMIFGEANNFYPIRFVPGENLEDIKKKLTETVDANHLKDVLIFTDIFCGSPYNAAAAYAMTHNNVELISGVSLPLCLEAVSNQSIKSLEEIVEWLKQVVPDTFKVLKDVLKEQEEEDF
ncbi:mannose/fructose/sorbose PTS transporter subunit IIA [Sporolactobacillus shoreicorticis]|uniref:PTS sugar transporter subunit IIA n=1 Tax=Sporolactobacillus shoreicorticis TaxID=1923877 RepID=A0ABW5S4A0_9BACL|nr:mannose/fructose/sorbose PTS transporter subunit IIA [Sporolactobacillus shoreicorticis]MCO7124329.1 mannose/fructose/sorbose PTS transporter subunit IIA [Sporolactobacillus shoreicorticis]